MTTWPTTATETGQPQVSAVPKSAGTEGSASTHYTRE